MKNRLDRDDAPEGCYAVKAKVYANGDMSCEGCEFKRAFGPCPKGRGVSCLGQYRKDKTNVIFKAKKP